MKKLVLKTASLTLAVVVALIALIYGSLALFAPASLARFYEGVDNYSLSAKYYEKQYDKSGEIEDLYTLCLKVDGYNDADRAEKYLELLIDNDSQSFNTFCSKKDNAERLSISTKEYIIGKYTCAVYKNKGMVGVIDATGSLIAKNYTDYNGFYLLITDENLCLSTAELSTVKTNIEIIMGSLSSESAIFAQRDIDFIDQLISN